AEIFDRVTLHQDVIQIFISILVVPIMASEKKISRTILARKMLQQFLEGDATFENFIAKDMKITDTNAESQQVNSWRSDSIISRFCGSLAVSTKGVRLTRVSTDINVSYITSVGYGDTIFVNAECVKLGKTLIFTTVDVHNKADGGLIALGRHTMLVTSTYDDSENEFKNEDAK
ncbi:13363_t:CDS:2, partial [Dentiscutata heterogama]